MKRVLLIAAVTLWASESAAWRCGTNLVDVDDLKQGVIDRCGKPSAHYSRKIPYELEVGDIHQRRRYQSIDFWVYLNGSHRFARILYFEDGVLQDIRKGNYSNEYDADPEQCLKPSVSIEINQTQPELELRCGSPDATLPVEEYTEAVVLSDNQRVMRHVQVYEWLYFKEDKAFVYRFHNGVLKWFGESERETYTPLL